MTIYNPISISITASIHGGPCKPMTVHGDESSIIGDDINTKNVCMTSE